MAWSTDALSLRKPTVVELPRAADRISFLALDHVRIWQDDTGVKAVAEDASIISIPVAALSVLMLGPGCSITTPAMATLHRAGCSVMITDGAATTAVVTSRPLTTRARWSEAQARIWANHEQRIAVAQTLYRDRFGKLNLPGNVTLEMLRGIEGRMMRKTYQRVAAQHGANGWKRDTHSDEPANRLLNLANSILYGSALAAVSALRLNPALGFVHEGAADALLFDLADHHKAAASIPLAFECAQLPERNQAHELRRRLRGYLTRKRVIAGHLKLLDRLIGPHLKADPGDVRGDTLVDDDPATSAPGHTSHHRAGQLDLENDLPF